MSMNLTCCYKRNSSYFELDWLLYVARVMNCTADSLWLEWTPVRVYGVITTHSNLILTV
jgi:hypothetical protein